MEERTPVFPPRKRVLLDSVVVDEKERGKGIYSRLQKRLERIAKEKGVGYIELAVDVSSPVVEIYKEKGYSLRHLRMKALAFGVVGEVIYRLLVQGP